MYFHSSYKTFFYYFTFCFSVDLINEMYARKITPKHTAFNNDSINDTYTQISLTMSLVAIISQLPFHSCVQLALHCHSHVPALISMFWIIHWVIFALVTRQSMESLKTAFNLLLIQRVRAVWFQFFHFCFKNTDSEILVANWTDTHLLTMKEVINALLSAPPLAHPSLPYPSRLSHRHNNISPSYGYQWINTHKELWNYWIMISSE